MNKLYVFLCAVLALATCTLTSCNGNKNKNAAAPQVNYETKVLQPESRVYNMIFPATTSGTTEIKVYPQVEGLITKKNFTTGTKVQKGQSLYVIDPTEYQLAVQSAQADLNVAIASMESSKLEYESNQKLYEKKIISDYVLNTSLNNYNSAKASVTQAQALLNIARTNLGYCTVTAPVTGSVDANGFDVGDMATRSKYLCTVSDNSLVDADFSITEADLLSIVKDYSLRTGPKGMEGPNGNFIGDVMPKLKLKLKDGSVYDHEGMVTKMDAIVNTTTGTVTCEAEFENPDGVLRSGLSANVILPITLDSILCVPQTAAVHMQDQTMFYRIKADGTVEGIICKVYPSNDGTEYYITDGLKAGDEVITNGANKLSNGDKVK